MITLDEAIKSWVENIKSEICDNAFTVTNPKNTYEYISVIDIAMLDEIFDKYVGAKMESEDKSCSNCKYWLLDKNNENRKCKYCFKMDEWVAESEE